MLLRLPFKKSKVNGQLKALVSVCLLTKIKITLRALLLDEIWSKPRMS